jgi:DNA-binding NarL/FixJ family response regulator
MQASPLRLLLSDDEAPLRRILRRLCEARGIDVVGEAANGVEAVHLARSLKPDAVLMDLRMPIMDGVEATRKIKDSNPGILVIFLSAYADASLQREAEEAGGDGWYLKGDPPRELCDRLLEYAASRD